MNIGYLTFCRAGKGHDAPADSHAFRGDTITFYINTLPKILCTSLLLELFTHERAGLEPGICFEAIPKESQKEDSFIKELSLVCVKPCLMDSQEDNDSIILNEDAFSAIVPIMQKYVAQEKENDTTVETAVLDSMQKLFSELSFPRDLPVVVFDKLYEQGIISVEGFRFWKDHGKEQQGRGY
eukprot:sb/3471567/